MLKVKKKKYFNNLSQRCILMDKVIDRIQSRSIPLQVECNNLQSFK